MRYLVTLLFVPTLVGCVMDDEFVAPPPPPQQAYSMPNACSTGGYRVAPPVYAASQTQEPPR